MASGPDNIDAPRHVPASDDTRSPDQYAGMYKPPSVTDEFTGDMMGDVPDDQLDILTASVTGDHAIVPTDPAPRAEPARPDPHTPELVTRSLRPLSTSDSDRARSAITPPASAGEPAAHPQLGAANIDIGSRDQTASAADAIRIEDGALAMASCDDAMWQNELGRYRSMVDVLLSIVILGALTLPFMGGSTTIKNILFGLMALILIACAWQRHRLRTPERVTRQAIIVTWLLVAVATCTAVAYLGIFSEANIMLALEFMLIGMTGHRLLIGLFTGVTFLFFAILGTLLCTGVVDDPGLIHASYLDTTNRVLTLILTQSVMLASIVLGLSTRREVAASFAKLQRAVQQAERQQSVVREVRQDLQKAANIGGRGPLTGHTVGSFRLGVLIGRGGMGEVYQAAHTDTHELAAVKFLQASAMDTPGARRRFAREIEVAASLTVPNIVRVLEVGGQDSVPYLAMEYLHGQDLARYLRKRTQLPMDRLIKLVREVGAGIHAAGQAGIVHRDIKPHNLFLAEIRDPDTGKKRRVWKILDFGVATAQSFSSTLSQGHVVGTPAYMAPEQARGQAVTHAADLYALASIVYRSVTGHPPYSGDDLPSLLYRVVHEMPRRPTRLADIPEAFDAALAVGMAKDPDARFASADELADAIAEAAHGRVSEALRQRAADLAETHPWR